jgi:hypothetical protein
MHPSLVTHPRPPLSVLIAIALAAAFVAGCDSSQPVDAGPVIGDPSVAWQAQPFRLAEPVLAAAIASCRPMQLPAQARPVLVDARGADWATIVYESIDRKTQASCSTRRSGDGTWLASGGSAGSGDEAPPVPAAGVVEQNGVQTEGGDTLNGLTAATRSIAVGRVGANVAGVQLVVAGRPITATVGNGWFSAWWPTGDIVTQWTAIGADGQAISQAPPIP